MKGPPISEQRGHISTNGNVLYISKLFFIKGGICGLLLVSAGSSLAFWLKIVHVPKSYI